MSKRQSHALQSNCPTLAWCHPRTPAGSCLSYATDLPLEPWLSTASRKQWLCPETPLLVTTKKVGHRTAHNRGQSGPEHPYVPKQRTPPLWPSYWRLPFPRTPSPGAASWPYLSPTSHLSAHTFPFSLKPPSYSLCPSLHHSYP